MALALTFLLRKVLVWLAGTLSDCKISLQLKSMVTSEEPFPVLVNQCDPIASNLSLKPCSVEVAVHAGKLELVLLTLGCGTKWALSEDIKHVSFVVYCNHLILPLVRKGRCHGDPMHFHDSLGSNSHSLDTERTVAFTQPFLGLGLSPCLGM